MKKTMPQFLTKLMEFHVIKLPKLPKELKENCNNLELWAKFINAEEKEELEMIAKQNVYIQSAYDKLEIISQDKQKRLEYEARQKALLDHNQFLHEATQRGIEEGIGIGRQEGKLAIAKNLIKLEYPTEEIVKITGLSAEVIESNKK